MCTGTLNNNKNLLYKEFPDLFFAGVREFAYSNKKYGPEVFYVENNKEYFEEFQCWANYVERNYLQDFFVDEKYVIFVQLAPLTWRFPFYFPIAKSLTDDERQECITLICKFLTNASEIIKKRAKRLCNIIPDK